MSSPISHLPSPISHLPSPFAFSAVESLAVAADAPLPEKYRWLIQLNPMTAPIETFRAIFLGGSIPWPALGISTALTAALLVAGILIFNKVEQSFMDTV